MVESTLIQNDSGIASSSTKNMQAGSKEENKRLFMKGKYDND